MKSSLVASQLLFNPLFMSLRPSLLNQPNSSPAMRDFLLAVDVPFSDFLFTLREAVHVPKNVHVHGPF